MLKEIAYITDNHLKRVIYRAKYRGMLETELIFRQFIRQNIEKLNNHSLKLFEELLYESDPDIMSWYLHKTPTPDKYKILNIFNK